ncbi:hypothetical protein GCK72_006940 [Caenorhabditis remanei]|uniref:Nuclear transport factor 2-like domain-containing protein n=1 Tax=Caenorhabditis remanei TaxID=31234 RepID=A0A6A5HMD9_CAERE|nr:hypothetical protein GCK72_006940 [Caenorhabditis remanei]KAF1766982.1 hypothetical protein GCK72_006940 [Caenorhabditis remanei]
MRLPILLLVSILGFVSVFGAPTDPDAIEISHNFFKRFMKAINSGDLFQVLGMFSPQKGDTNVDAGHLISELKGLRVSFRSANFVGANVNVSCVFRPPKTEKAAKSAEFILEKNAEVNTWLIKSMSDVKGPKTAQLHHFYPPLVMG